MKKHDLKDRQRVLVWSKSSPEDSYGSSTVLRNLFEHAADFEYRVISERRNSNLSLKQVNYRVYRIDFVAWLWPFSRGVRIRELLKYLAVPLMVLVGLFHIIKFKPRLILVLYLGDLWILSGYLLHLLTRVPLVVYAHDPYIERAKGLDFIARNLAIWLEPRILRCARVLVLYKSLGDLYFQKYGIRAEVVRHILPTSPQSIRPKSRRDFPILVFAGSIYDNNRDLLRQLALAMKRLDGRMEFRAFTSASDSLMEGLGFSRGRDCMWRYEASPTKLLEELGQCDLGYLPLSFTGSESLERDALKYVFPTKAVDYLAAGLPILAHCPSDFETNRFFADTQAGYCLNNDGDEFLYQFLDKWVRNTIAPIEPEALARAVSLFTPQANSFTFYRVLREVMSAN